MAYVALQLNGVTMPWPALPDGYKEDRSFPEVFRELSNGVVAQQLLRSGSVIIFSIAWKGLTMAEYATVAAAYNAAAGTVIGIRTPLNESFSVRHNPQSAGMNVRFYKLGGVEAVDVQMSLQATP